MMYKYIITSSGDPSPHMHQPPLSHSLVRCMRKRTTMATASSSWIRSVAAFTILLALLPMHPMSVALELDVGGDKGWVVPGAGDVLSYNRWASDNRFVVGDSVRFRYKKDSVMVVETEEEYRDCKSQHPIFFSNNGDTIYKLHRPGTFYFISGAAGHCDRGQRMIVKVLPPSPSPAAAPPFNLTHDVASAAAVVSAVGMPGSIVASVFLLL